MNFIQHKSLFLLSLFFMLPATTYCMKRKHSELSIIEPTTILDLKNKRYKLEKRLNELDTSHEFWNYGTRNLPDELFLSCTYHQDLHKKTYGEMGKRKKYCIEFNIKIYSQYNIEILGNILPHHLKALKGIRSQDTLYSALGSAVLSENKPYKEKQQFIQKLLNLGFIPTPEDKEVAILELWERKDPIIQKVCSFPYVFLSADIPKDIISSLLKFIIKMELLF